MPEVYTAGKTEKESPKDITGIVGQPSGGLFSAYIVRPAWVNFATEETGEQIILLLRRHWVTNVPWILLAILMILGPFVLTVFPLLAFLPARFQLMGVLFWYLLTMALIFEGFLGWFYNIFIVTDERVVDIDFVGLIYREISEARISRVQSATFSQGGLVQAIFNFGLVLVQTAAEIQNIEFEDVPNPSMVVRTIDSLIPHQGGP